MFTNSILGNYSFEFCAMENYFGEFCAETIEKTAVNTQLEALPRNSTDELHYNMVDDSANFVKDSSFDITSDSMFWTFYFDGSNCLEAAGAGRIFIGSQGNQHLMANRLEFASTNNTAEYEGFLQCLKKAIDMKVENLKVFGYS